jgi:diguanylate cyclase (GGDEF)-like protein
LPVCLAFSQIVNGRLNVDQRGKDPADFRSAAAVSAQIQQSFRQLPLALGVNLVVGLLLTALLWQVIDHTKLMFWITALALVTGGRFALLFAFKRAPRVDNDHRSLQRPFVLGACGSGLVWGAAGVLLFHPTSFVHQVLLSFALGGMMAGGVPLLSFLDRAYPCFAIPILMPISVKILAMADRVHLFMGLMVLIFGFTMLAASSQTRRFFRDSVNLRAQLSVSMETSQELEQMLRIDALTGIANRRLFDEVLDKEWRRAQRDGTVLAVVMADIDHFKSYNDRYGHPAGDRCLVAVAHAMRGALHRPGDLVARIGGEEFAFLLPDTPLAGAGAVAEQIRRSVLGLELRHEVPSVTGPVTVSLGLAAADNPAIKSPGDLLRASDQALYRAKRGGRNQVAVAAR